jgi:1-deoxy-D-xylulose-5-phosphate reductoisomerase
VLNAANEVAVASFLAGRIAFRDIAATVEQALDAADCATPGSIADVLDVDHRTRLRLEASMKEQCA